LTILAIGLRIDEEVISIIRNALEWIIIPVYLFLINIFLPMRVEKPSIYSTGVIIKLEGEISVFFFHRQMLLKGCKERTTMREMLGSI